MRAGIAFVGLLLAVGNAHAEGRQVSLDWLKTVAFASHQTDYSGVFVYQYGGKVETSRIIHVVEADGEYEKLECLDGPKREIIRHNGHIWEYNNHKMVRASSQGRGKFPSLLPEQLSALSANYQASQVGVERVAGYDAQVVLFQPRDNLRYAHKLWVHNVSGLLLKASVLDDKNRPVEQYAFTQLQIGGGVDRSWIKNAPSMAERGSGDGAQAVGVPVNSGWVVDSLPAGFKKTMEIQRPMRGRHAPVTQLVFSDGLSAISVFIEPDDGDEDDNSGLSTRGAMNLFHKVANGHLITVVGEVPARAVMQVADSLRYNGPQ
ncbi:MAG TPA: MucB/RseB C-terminal domain-containing protein [Gallionella sp.]|nr:MucB/RseB C-terminal domain-containing protein [Gallionella sp.]